MRRAVIVAVSAAGSVGGHVAGEFPFSHKTFPCAGGYPFRVFMAADADVRSGQGGALVRSCPSSAASGKQKRHSAQGEHVRIYL